MNLGAEANQPTDETISRVSATQDHLSDRYEDVNSLQFVLGLQCAEASTEDRSEYLAQNILFALAIAAKEEMTQSHSGLVMALQEDSLQRSYAQILALTSLAGAEFKRTPEAEEYTSDFDTPYHRIFTRLLAHKTQNTPERPDEVNRQDLITHLNHLAVHLRSEVEHSRDAYWAETNKELVEFRHNYARLVILPAAMEACGQDDAALHPDFSEYCPQFTSEVRPLIQSTQQ